MGTVCCAQCLTLTVCVGDQLPVAVVTSSPLVHVVQIVLSPQSPDPTFTILQQKRMLLFFFFADCGAPLTVFGFRFEVPDRKNSRCPLPCPGQWKLTADLVGWEIMYATMVQTLPGPIKRQASSAPNKSSVQRRTLLHHVRMGHTVSVALC